MKSMGNESKKLCCQGTAVSEQLCALPSLEGNFQDMKYRPIGKSNNF
jgi:hypothetical protein